MTSPKTLTVQETARLLGVGKSTLYDAVAAGTVDPCLRMIRIGNVTRFSARSVYDFLGEDEAA